MLDKLDGASRRLVKIRARLNTFSWSWGCSLIRIFFREPEAPAHPGADLQKTVGNSIPLFPRVWPMATVGADSVLPSIARGSMLRLRPADCNAGYVKMARI